MRRLIEIVDGPHETAERAAALFSEYAAQAGPFRVALSGGETPRALYELLARDYSRRVEWERTEFFWGDERCTPPELSGSNYRMARDAFLGPLGIPPERIHRVEAERPAAEAALRYEGSLRRVLGERPRFDLALMGLGPDGHTASLFPGAPVLRESSRLAREVKVEALKSERVTLTLPVFNASARVLFLVTGSEKAEAVRKAVEGSVPPVPAALVRPDDGEVVWLLDKDAARLLGT
jgi:6-phosphogluconolactonase